MTLDLSSAGWAERIVGLKKQTQELRQQRQSVAKELKAAQRKNKRLKERARCLSEEDMVNILVMKRQKTMVVNGASDPTATEAGAGSSSSSSTGSAPTAAGTPGAPASEDDAADVGMEASHRDD